MASTQDAQLGFVAEGTYKTFVAPTKFVEMVDESLDWDKQIKQGVGLRVGGRVARSARRVVVAADGKGDFSIEATSKGMGTLFNAGMGTGVATLVSGATYQHVFTLGDTLPSLTLQKGLPEVGGTVDAYTFLGAMIDSWELAFPNADIATLKCTVDAGDLTTAQALATASYPTTPNLFHFANGTISSGTITAPTGIALGSGTTATTNIRGGTIALNNNLRGDRFNYGGVGRKSKPTAGLREISGTLTIEYDAVTYRDLVINDGALTLLVQFTGGALSTGVETLQVVLSEIKLDGKLPAANGTDLIVQTVNFKCLDNLTAAQPIWVVQRTADVTF